MNWNFLYFWRRKSDVIPCQPKWQVVPLSQKITLNPFRSKQTKVGQELNNLIKDTNYSHWNLLSHLYMKQKRHHARSTWFSFFRSITQKAFLKPSKKSKGRLTPAGATRMGRTAEAMGGSKYLCKELHCARWRAHLLCLHKNAQVWAQEKLNYPNGETLYAEVF